LEEMHRESDLRIAASLGGQIASLVRNQTFRDGVLDDDDPGPVGIEFTSHPPLLFAVARSADQVVVESKRLEPVETYEAFGSVWSRRRLEMLEKAEYMPLRGAILVSAEAVIFEEVPSGVLEPLFGSSPLRYLVGWRLRFDTGFTFHFWAESDESRISVTRGVVPPQGMVEIVVPLGARVPEAGA